MTDMDYPVIFSRVRSSSEPEFAGCLDIYHEAFPVFERQPDELIRQRIDDDSCILLAGKREGEIVSMSVLWNFEGTPYFFLDYFAVKHSNRGYQLGTRFLQYIVGNFLQNGRHLIIEVEHPHYGDKDERAKRVRFYVNNGGVTINNVRYFLPPLGGAAEPMEMQLMILPRPGEMPGEEVIQSLISTIYKKVYQKDYRQGL